MFKSGTLFWASSSFHVVGKQRRQTAKGLAVQEPGRRQHLWRLVERLGAGLGVRAASPIVPVVIGSEADALAASAALLARGFHVPAIRPPTVPAGTSRCGSGLQ